MVKRIGVRIILVITYGREGSSLAPFLFLLLNDSTIFTLVNDIELQRDLSKLRRKGDIALDSREGFAYTDRTSFPTGSGFPCPAAELK